MRNGVKFVLHRYGKVVDTRVFNTTWGISELKKLKMSGYFPFAIGCESGQMVAHYNV